MTVNTDTKRKISRSDTGFDVVKRAYAPQWKKLMLSIYKHKFFYLMLAPAVILLAIFAYQPMYGVLIAFKQYSFRKGILGSPWVGLDNFATLFAMEEFTRAFRNTVIINLLKLVFGFPMPILLAIMLNAVRNKFAKNAFQTIVYLPHFISWVIVSGLIFSLLDERSGSLFKLMEVMGLNPNVFGSGPQFLALLVISDIWKGTGWGAIIYLAALSGISPEYYEAAKIDGASTVKQFWFITLPLLFPTINIMLILRVGGLIGGGFDQVYNLYNEQLYGVADILDTFVYRFGIGQGQFALGAAIGLFTNIINIVLLYITNRITKLLGGNSFY